MKSVVLLLAFGLVNAKKKCAPQVSSASVATPTNGYSVIKEKQDPLKLSCKQINGTSYKPTTLVEAQYENKLETADQLVNLRMQLGLKLPVVNLDSYAEITTVECSGNKISLNFINSHVATDAYSAWSTENNWGVLLGYEHCQKTFNTYEVENVSHRNGSAVVVIDAKPVEIGNFIQDYEVALSQSPKDSLDKRWSMGNSITWPLNLNYDSITKSVINSNISVIDDNSGQVFCNDCYIQGQVKIELLIKGNLSKINSYSLKLGGILNGNMDLDASGLKVGSDLDFRKTLFALIFTPITIPGIISINAGIAFDLAVSTKLVGNDKLNLRFGFDYSFPFQFEIGVQNGSISLPVSSEGIDPIVNYHQITPADRLFDVNSHVYPTFDVHLNIFNNKLFNSQVELNTYFGISALAADLDACPLDRIELKLFHQHSIYLKGNLLGIRNLWTTERLSLACIGWETCDVPVTACVDSPTTRTTSTNPTSTSTAIPSTVSAPDGNLPFKLVSRIAGAVYCDGVFKLKLFDLLNCNEPCSGLANNTILEATFSSPRYNSRGFISYSKPMNTIFVVYRGTEGFLDALQFPKQNFTLADFGEPSWTKRIRPKLPNDMLVHQGYKVIYDSMRKKVMKSAKEIAEKYPSANIIFSGHSMGASLSTLAAVDFESLYGNGHRISVYTFGMPRLGNKKWARYVNDLPFADRMYRLVRRGDPFGDLPALNIDYEHVRNPYYILDDESVVKCKVEIGTGESPECLAEDISVRNPKKHYRIVGYWSMGENC